MFCKECGVENQDENIRCKICNTYLQSSDSPLSGGDRVKVIAFFAFLILPFGWFGGSSVIIFIALFELYIMKKDQSFTPIINAKKWIKVYLVVLVLVMATITTALYYDEKAYDRVHVGTEWYDTKEVYNENINVETAMVAGAVLLATPIVVSFFMSIFNNLFFKPLEEHKNWILEHGIFADKPYEKSILDIATEKLQSFQKPQSYSIADELLKWKALLDQGIITEEEFNTKKEKLLK